MSVSDATHHSFQSNKIFGRGCSVMNKSILQQERGCFSKTMVTLPTLIFNNDRKN